MHAALPLLVLQMANEENIDKMLLENKNKVKCSNPNMQLNSKIKLHLFKNL